MKIALPDTRAQLVDYHLVGQPVAPAPLSPDSARVVYSAAHVVRDPFADGDITGQPALDWDATLAFRGHLASLGLGIAEAMDTAQRGMGLDWPTALELIRRTKSAFPKARVANGCGTDHLPPVEARTLAEVTAAYLTQVDAIQAAGGRIILMASRALAKVARDADDYKAVYRDVLAACDEPVILHWLGDMFDPALSGYWGTSDFSTARNTVLEIIQEHQAKIDGIKISLLDAQKEIEMRRRLPDSVRMYTGDDFNYPELIAGDAQGFSHALLGIFDPLAAHAANAVRSLDAGDMAAFRAALDPTVPLARHIFRAPTQYYKTGVVFLAWLNGHQDHFKMIGGAEAMRSLPYFVDCFRLADRCGALANPELAVERMGILLHGYGVR
ncbi:dihydrodipicolinate synthase family protein [Roseibaca sp. Y0-43]|uniref:dihydrodipicolinate synthase family protein n=1 Tax=Roseibaca sp. Y0-43 TaxID=2816854 RepID=UPI001D0C23CA|nr:dihydrodipicolinate synthase family protein [Roseibaca sp. Y0-43]MCC1482290.1 dihydrodipicolinate synthase family protein [Roseibaca sp. Y0-43]